MVYPSPPHFSRDNSVVFLKAAEGGLGWGQNHRGSGGGSPQRGPGAEPRYGVWGRSPPEAEEYLNVVTFKCYAFLVVFHTFSPIHAYVFSVFAGIIPLSLRNGGHLILIPFTPLVCKWGGGNCPLSPGSAAYAYSALPCTLRQCASLSR